MPNFELGQPNRDGDINSARDCEKCKSPIKDQGMGLTGGKYCCSCYKEMLHEKITNQNTRDSNNN